MRSRSYARSPKKPRQNLGNSGGAHEKASTLAIPMCLVFLLFLAIEDGFSRGGRGGGFGGGGFRGGGYGGGYRGGGGAAYRGGGASYRSPSMSSYSRSRSSVSRSRPQQSRSVASRPQRPSTPGRVASQRPSFFRPKAFFGCRLKSTEQGSWRRTVEADPGSTSAVVESSSTGRKRDVGSGQDWSRCCRGSPWICRGEATAWIARTWRRKARPWR